MIVASVTVGLLEGAPIVVAPCKVMLFVMSNLVVQLAVPDGTTTVSPSWAERIAELTSPSEALLALTTALAALTWTRLVNRMHAIAAMKRVRDIHIPISTDRLDTLLA
jgi:hypothetical protein